MARKRAYQTTRRLFHEQYLALLGMVGGSHLLYADPDPFLHVNADPDPIFYFYADPDPASPPPHQSDANLRPLVFRPSTAPFEPLKLLIFDFNADPDPAFHSSVDPDPDLAFQNNADPVRNPAFAGPTSRLYHRRTQKHNTWHNFSN
jgi:hypothetical protein